MIPSYRSLRVHGADSLLKAFAFVTNTKVSTNTFVQFSEPSMRVELEMHANSIERNA